MAVDMSSPNLALWRQVEATDPKYVKPITGKPYSGNSPHPHWLKLRMTEMFGPAGKGWGVKVLRSDFTIIPDFVEIKGEVVQGSRVLHSVIIELWYIDPETGQRCATEEAGGTEAAGIRKSGAAYGDEDAVKKSITDAFVKAASALGFCGDIFLGRWDDSKYVEQRREAEDVAGKVNTIKLAAAKAAELKAKVDRIIGDLEAAQTREEYLQVRARALGLKPDLAGPELQDMANELADAVKAAASRFPNPQRKTA